MHPPHVIIIKWAVFGFKKWASFSVVLPKKTWTLVLCTKLNWEP